MSCVVHQYRDVLCHLIFSKDFTNQAFFAVYDGHSGVDASNYAASHLHCYLARNKNIGTDPKLALKEAFLKVDESFVVKAKREVRTTHSSAGEVTCLHGCKEFYLIAQQTMYPSRPNNFMLN